LKGKIMGGNPVFRGTRVPVHMLAELVPSRVRAHASPEGKCAAIVRPPLVITRAECDRIVDTLGQALATL
jgi:4-aminobutyrate aminotransferase-like enzyme